MNQYHCIYDFLRLPLISSLCVSIQQRTQIRNVFVFADNDILGGNESFIFDAFSGSLILSVIKDFGVLILNFVTEFFFDVKMIIFFVDSFRANFRNLRMSRICFGCVCNFNSIQFNARLLFHIVRTILVFSAFFYSLIAV